MYCITGFEYKKAKREHICEECGAKIKQNETYCRETWSPWDGAIICAKCGMDPSKADNGDYIKILRSFTNKLSNEIVEIEEGTILHVFTRNGKNNGVYTFEGVERKHEGSKYGSNALLDTDNFQVPDNNYEIVDEKQYDEQLSSQES